MTEDLLAPEPDAPGRPEHVPEQFWDPAAGQIRTDDLARAYAELAQRVPQVPESPDGYELSVPEDFGAADPEINRRLHAAGFTPAQAQLVYDLAAEHLGPLMANLAADFEAERQTERLVREFGGEASWREIAGQLRAWGKANLKPETLAALSATYEGVMALRSMMAPQEPGLPGGDAGELPADENAVRALMRDPRYWRDREPDIVERVTQAFRRLYGD